MQSILILGRQPALGLAELESLYGAEHVSLLGTQTAALDIPPSEVRFARLGGSTRLGMFLAEVPSKLWKDVEKELARLAPQLAADLPEGKIRLGLTAIGIPVTPQKLVASGLTLKKVIRAKTGRSVRLVPNTEPELNTAQVLHNQLTGQTGVEFLVVATEDGKTVIARTVAAQDIDSYTLRDRGRPKRDARVGMLPPKLAQIIINLATGPNTAGLVLDPFCGTGVVLQEALLMGYDAYGSDLEPRMVEYSKSNMEWLSDNFAFDQQLPKIETGDATTHTWDPQPTFVAAETYLGRPFTEAPAPDVLTTTIGDCNQILTKFLRNVWESIPYGTRLCLAVPAWQTAPGRFRHLPLIDDVVNLGYNRVSFEHIRSDNLLYYRTDQIVARELLILTRK